MLNGARIPWAALIVALATTCLACSSKNPPQGALDEYKLLSRWLVEVYRPRTPLERHQLEEMAGPTLVGDSLYLANPNGGFEKRLVATGEVLWSTPLDAVSQASWAYSDGLLYGGDVRGNLYSIEAATGKIRWKTPNKGVYFSRPLVGADQIWILTSGGTIQSYRRDSGQWLWQQADPNPKSLSLWSFQGPVLFSGLIIAGFPSSILQAFDPSTGKVMWNESLATLPEGADNFNDLKSVAVPDQFLIASSFSGDLKAWQAMAGSKKLAWQKPLSLYAPISIDPDGSTIYASVRDGTVKALELKTGFVRWSFELPRGLPTQAAVGKDVVWVGSSAGEVFILSKDGKKLAQTNDLQTAIWNPPTLLSDDEALVLTSQAVLRKLRLVKTSSR